MADIIKYNSKSISDIMSNIERYKYNPSGIQRAILDTLDEITDGEVDIVDPTNPFVFLLESSCVNTAVAINENLINLRKQYPSLAQTEDEIYLHMSDKDYIDRFALPADVDFTIVIQVNDLLNKLIPVIGQDYSQATIPRNTELHADQYIFSLQYPINIRKYNNGVVQISYDTELTSPLQTLSSNIIDYYVRRDTSQVDWLFFKVPVKQFSIYTSYYPIQLSSIFYQEIPFTDQFYYSRIFYRNNSSNNNWVEMKVTHTDQVFDPFKPTAVIKVYTDYVSVFIPTIYLTSGLISGDLRIDIYSTKGQLTVNLSSYKLESFSAKLKAIDEVRDINDYTNVLLNLSYYVYSDQIVNGGSNGIDFKTLRERVLFNSIGDIQLPITNIQLEAFVNNKGFDLIKNIDVITNRIFLAVQRLPKPINSRLLTSANIGINTFIASIPFLRTLSSVKDNYNRLTLMSNNLFINENGILRLLTKTNIDSILSLDNQSLVANVNSNQYLYNPFYYVLDNSEKEFELRAYNLDYPLASNLSFIRQNQTLQLPVNTGSYQLLKIPNGYKLIVITKSGNFYKQIEDNLVSAQLAYYPNGESTLAYINGVLESVLSDGERSYSFTIETNYDIDNNHLFCITNARMFTTETLLTWVELNFKAHIFYTTTSLTNNYIPDETDSILGKFILPDNSVAVTHETIDLDLGNALRNLWSRSRSFSTGLEYQVYESDIPMVYDKVIYETDPITNSIFTIDTNGEIVYNILHQIGDTVLDNDGNIVYKHRKGDVVLDNNGSPIVISESSIDKEIDLLLVDGKYYFTTDNTFKAYKSEMVGILDTWITNDLVDIQKLLLEQTKIYFYPKTTIGMVKVYPDSVTEDYITSEQSLIVDLYVSSNIYNDIDIRQQLSISTIKLIDNYINNSTINITEITLALKELYGDTVASLSIKGLGGDKNYNILNLANEHNRLCLKKKLILQQDNSLIIAEDITINFNNIEKSLTLN